MLKLAGQWWLAIALIHAIVGLAVYFPQWQAIAQAGWFNAVAPDPFAPIFERDAAFWFVMLTPFLIILGQVCLWANQQKLTLPISVGRLLLTACTIGIILMPISGFWLLLIPSGMMLYSSKRVTVNASITVHIIGSLTTAILLALSLLHIYWALGGNWGAVASVPTLNGQPLFEPGFWDTLAVALALSIAAVVCLGTLNYRLPFLPIGVCRIGIWGIAIVFLLRTIGEFHYFGFFKRVNDSLFAYWDTVLYTPLCLVLAIGCITLAVYTPKSQISSE